MSIVCHVIADYWNIHALPVQHLLHTAFFSDTHDILMSQHWLFLHVLVNVLSLFSDLQSFSAYLLLSLAYLKFSIWGGFVLQCRMTDHFIFILIKNFVCVLFGFPSSHHVLLSSTRLENMSFWVSKVLSFSCFCLTLDPPASVVFVCSSFSSVLTYKPILKCLQFQRNLKSPGLSLLQP